MDHLDAMRAFVSVAGLRSFAQAARQRMISVSAATRAVAQLEQQLGLELLIRTTRAVRLTEAGAAYLESCRRILDDLDLAERQVRGESAEPRGVLVVAAPILFGRLHVLQVLTTLLVRHPDLDVRLMLSDRNIHLVDDGVDVAIRIGELADSGLMAMRLGSVTRVLAASPDYLARRGTPSVPSDLAVHDLITFEGIDATRDWRFADGETVRMEPRLAVNSADACIAAAEAGLGITRTLSYQVRASVEAGRLKLVLPNATPPALPVHAVYPARRLGSANLSAFLAAAREGLKRNAAF